VGVGAELLVFLLLVEVVPPLVATGDGAGIFPLAGVVEIEDLAAVVLVPALEADALAGGEEGDRAEADAVALDG
jgi:hypothetical protein